MTESLVTGPDRFINRELSLLAFQARVLALAANESTPLLERVKFIAIVSQNVDEFFQVRVAGLKEQVRTGITSPAPDGMTPQSQLIAIRDRVDELMAERNRLWMDVLRPALELEGIRIVLWADLDEESKTNLRSVFDEQIFPVLTPLAVDPSHPFPYVSNLSLNLAVQVSNPKTGQAQFARVKVPPILPRFVSLNDNERFLPLEEMIAAHLDRLFPGRKVLGHSTFRVTRNADFAVEEEEANDLLEAMESVLRFRSRGARAVRLQIRTGTSENVKDLLTRELRLSPDDVYESRAPLALGGLFALHGIDRPDLKDPSWTPTTQKALSDRGEQEADLFAVISESDILVHHPYESFSNSTGAFVAQAAADRNVLAIKQTLYRTSVPEDPALGGEESIVESLMEAASRGKQVVVLVELKARFDEAANITWARMLEDAGVHVVYGVAGLKTHSKALLVVRREGDRVRRYSHIGTGNYNPKTSRLYEDVGLFTADPDIGADLSDLFNTLTGYGVQESYRKLIVAPQHLRPRIIERIRQEAASGPDGRITMKINHLVDSQVIDALYEASQAGCPIDLIVRGNCAIRPGVPGLSETISVRSIVGEFLEHSRIYRFGQPSDGAVYYVGSADMMERNLDGRVEALVPVTDPRLKLRLEEILEVLSEDDELAWELGPDATWTKVPTEKHVSAHARLKELAILRSKG